MIKKTTILLVMVLAIAFLGLALVAFGLPKDKQAASTSVNQTAAPAKAPVTFKRATVAPIPADDGGNGDVLNFNSVPYGAKPGLQRAGGPSRQLSAGVPYVIVRTGVPETPGGNNHMRPQVKVANDGVAHMVYGVFDDDANDTTISNPADSNTNGLYFYNAYDCSNSNALRNGSKDVEMTQTFTGIGDSRPRDMQLGGIMVPNPATGVPVVFGHRLVQRTDLGNGLFSRRGWATMKDGAECLGLFSMDTSVTNTNAQHPYMYAVNESTWVATFRNGATPNVEGFSYTTNRGISWSAFGNIGTYSPWFNSVTITGTGNTFYIVSMTDPADVNAFESTERPVYLKGTYNPVSGAVTFGTMTDIYAQAGFAEPSFLPCMLDIGAAMVGDTLHVAFLDWNNWLGQGVGGPGGHVHHAAVLPDGTINGVQKIADINLDGRLPKMTTTAFGFGIDPWSQVDLSFNSSTNVLYCLWSQPPDDGNLGWADYEATGTLGVFDIFCSSSPNNGRGWDAPANVTQTNNPGCTGTAGNPCANEYWFSADERVVEDTIWIAAMVEAYPGIQESAIASGIQPDVGPFSRKLDQFRLYKAPARTPVLSARGSLAPPPGDTLNPYAILLAPGLVTPFTASLRLSNIGLLGFLTDSIKIDAAFNDGFLVTTSNFNPGEFVPVGGAYDFGVLFNTAAVTPASIGGRSGNVKIYVHSTSPASNQVIFQYFSVYIIPNLCLNRKVRIHSSSNSTDVGSQGSIKDQGGNGLRYPFNGSDRFYDGGVWITNSALNVPNVGGIPGVPRKTTRQIFSDKYLRCLSDVKLDSTAGSGYYNLYAVSVATDLEDSTIVYKNVWEQSTHADSGDFLIQNVKAINIGSTPIDSVALGVIYDVDVFSSTGISNPAENVNGDTAVTYNGRKFWLGWIAGNDVAIDTCAPNNEMYGVVVIPDGIGNPGDSIHPRGAVMYDQVDFSYNVGFGNAAGGDSLCSRWAYNLNVSTSGRRRTNDSLTGADQDTVGLLPGHYFICGGPGAGATGAPYRNDEGYFAVAKKVKPLATNQTGDLMVARYGLDGLVAGQDSAFKGEGASYTVIHVASNGGLSDLMTNAVKGIDWYAKHANYQVGPYQNAMRRGDFDNNTILSPSDVVGMLNTVFLGFNAPGHPETQVPVCVADVDLNGAVLPSDAVILLNKVFLGSGCPWCLIRCP